MLYRTTTRLPLNAVCIMAFSVPLAIHGHQSRPIQCDNRAISRLVIARCNAPQWGRPFHLLNPLATERELSDFLKDVEKRAFKRTVYHVRNDESALDIVQDSMMKLAEHYGDRPVTELPMLFQRILSNSTLDWFRRQKTQKALFSNLSDFETDNGDLDDFDLLETLSAARPGEQNESAQTQIERTQILQQIEVALEDLPARQREAFLLRYWEDMDVAETAEAMGCSQGSVKTHCSRAVQALAKALIAKGIRL